MNKLLKAFFLATANVLTLQPLAIAANPWSAPVPINDYHGNWSATAGAYAAGSVVTLGGKNWLSLADGNATRPGAPDTDTQWRLLGDAKPLYYRPGDPGPGGGVVFFVDRQEQFPTFDYLEAAPDDVGAQAWCDRASATIPKARARAIGRGKANTQAMLAVCASGAARAAADYRGPRGKADWFLPSLGELMLMYRFAEQSGKVSLDFNYIWSSSESGAKTAWYQPFDYGALYEYNKDGLLHVRPIRAF